MSVCGHLCNVVACFLRRASLNASSSSADVSLAVSTITMQVMPTGTEPSWCQATDSQATSRQNYILLVAHSGDPCCTFVRVVLPVSRVLSSGKWVSWDYKSMKICLCLGHVSHSIHKPGTGCAWCENVSNSHAHSCVSCHQERVLAVFGQLASEFITCWRASWFML